MTTATASTTIIFIEHDGKEHRVAVAAGISGLSVMQAAFDASVPGLLADCGGACACGTCHAYVEGEAAARLPPASSSELDMVECAIDVRAASRLTCQLIITPALDGLVVRLPRTQI